MLGDIPVCSNVARARSSGNWKYARSGLPIAPPMISVASAWLMSLCPTGAGERAAGRCRFRRPAYRALCSWP